MPLILESPERFATVYRERLQPWMTTDLSLLAGAVGQMFEQTYDLAADQGVDGDGGYVPGWGVLLDPDLCPGWALPYLGQFAGVTNLIGVADSAARGAIRSQTARHRGTPASLTAAAAATLTGSRTVVLTERYLNDPYQVQAITYTSETPSPQATFAAMLTVKPAGILLTHSVYTGWSIAQMEAHFVGQTISVVEGMYSTLTDFESDR